MQPAEQLFRRESGRILSALTRLLGVHNLELAQDVLQEAFCKALEVWEARGMPDNPGAWLMTAAKNRALDLLRRERTARGFAPELSRLMESEWTRLPLVDEAFSPEAMQSEQLRMMFSCCHPRLPEEVQLCLVLHILCGFGAHEIGGALLVSRAAIEKRITRGKQQLADSARLFDLDDAAFDARLATVQRALYLLFSEGYHGASAEAPVRAELCREALQLVQLLRRHPAADTPISCALAALMCLHAARLPARMDAQGDLHPLVEQDRARWDRRLLAEGLALFEQSAAGDVLSAYHVEAAIAAAHAAAPCAEQTDWPLIVSLYERLAQIAPSPVVALNHAIALAQRDGPAAGIAALNAIDAQSLAESPFYAAALAELWLRAGDRSAARAHFGDALRRARNQAERRLLARRLAACSEGE